MSLLVDGTALAQSADDDDLEVPAGGAGQPPVPPLAPAPPPPPGETPAIPVTPVAAPPAPPPAAPATSPADAARIADLERRLLAVEALEEERAASAARPKEVAESHGQTTGANQGLSRSPFSIPIHQGFRVDGFVQAEYLRSQFSEDQLDASGAPLNQDRFYLRRGRLRVDHGWENVALALELDASTVGSPVVGVRRAEGSLFYRGSNGDELPPVVAVTAGVTDLPFGYELYETDRFAPFLERSSISNALFPSRADVGVRAWGAYRFLRYGVMVSNGEPVTPGALPRDPNAAKDVTGRLGAVTTIGESFEIAGGASFATGKGFSPGRPARKTTIVWQDDNADNVSTPDELHGQLGSAAEPSLNFDRWAFGVDLGLRLKTGIGETHLRGELLAASNYDRGFLVSNPAQSGIDVRQFGGYVALTQELTRYALVGLRYSTYDPNSDVIESRANRIEPKSQTIRTVSPVISLRIPGRARLTFQYDFIRDYLARDTRGVPTDAKNDQFTARLQVDL